MGLASDISQQFSLIAAVTSGSYILSSKHNDISWPLSRRIVLYMYEWDLAPKYLFLQTLASCVFSIVDMFFFFLKLLLALKLIVITNVFFPTTFQFLYMLNEYYLWIIIIILDTQAVKGFENFNNQMTEG